MKVINQFQVRNQSISKNITNERGNFVLIVGIITMGRVYTIGNGAVERPEFELFYNSFDITN